MEDQKDCDFGAQEMLRTTKYSFGDFSKSNNFFYFALELEICI